MARRPRLQIAGAVYHVMTRGNRKAPIFEDDTDREYFLATIGEVWRRYAIRCYAACLMTNHYHLVFDTPRNNLSDAMQYLNGVYSQTSNRRHERTGHMFEGRFRSLVVERASYLRRVARYVVLNPVRAHLVGRAESWRWSTYRATAGIEEAPEWLEAEWLTAAFKARTPEEARQRYMRYVNSPTQKKVRQMDTVTIGSRAFEKTVRTAALERLTEDLLPKTIMTLGRPPLESLFMVSGLAGGERDRLIQIAHVTHGYRLAEISRYLGCHRSTASQALRRRAMRPLVNG